MMYTTKLMQVFSNVFKSQNLNIGGANEVTKRIAHENDKPWPTPTPIKAPDSTVIGLSEKMLPNVLFKYSKDQAYRFNDASAEFVVSSIITCASALIGASYKIAPKERDKRWTVTQALWCLNIGEPSLLKTPTTRVGINLVNFAQNEVINPGNVIRENEAKIKEKQIKALSAQAHDELDKGDEEAAQLLFEQAGKLKESIAPQRNVVINDCTPEALVIHLESNPNGCLIVRDELHGWLSKVIGSDNTSERSLYTEAFEGSNSYSQKRITREKVDLALMHVGVLGCIQPDRLRPLLTGRTNGESNDGFYERFQLAIFSSTKMKYTDSLTCDTLQNKMEHIFCCLASLKEQNINGCANFTSEAQVLWNKWAPQQAEKTISENTNMQSVMGKYPSLVAKLSLVFQLITEAESQSDYSTFNPSGKVSYLSLEQAICFSELLLSNNRRIQELSSKSNELDVIKHLVNKLEKLPTQFSQRDLQRKGWTGLKNAEQCKPVLEQLESMGYIRKITIAQQGQKSTERFLKNPLIS
ncbi:DUF3987 domain-containing protein [Pseudoalteromonas sp. MEBiC 03485]|uniref:DUF3987 domain-containing protein n=1 Tax=Pseudoalteromonas sp. MEBiC 03485 TaxID=2571103 RepID=UPI00101FD850|nr:DUF3987 domain-containing protein [Pseudoalteromonas sp. MEBiC 03485]RZD22226.1 DUF3987 domain-containing protein [Pseudoalteromonas sp. MEBiC 03485]